MLQWLRKQNCPFSKSIIVDAAYHVNHLEMWDWLLQEGFKMKDKTFETALRIHNVQLLKWLHEKECPRPDPAMVFELAVSSGDLSMFQWLTEKGYLKGPFTIDFAVKPSNFAIVKWLVEEQSAKLEQKKIELVFNEFVRWFAPGELKWLKEKGFTFHDGDLEGLVKYDQREILLRIWKCGFPLPPDLQSLAMRENKSVLANWLKSVQVIS